MATLSASQITQKWVTNFGSAGTSMQQGVQAVNQAPGAKAAAAAQLWISRLQASQAKWQNRVGAVTLAEWQNAMITLGIPRAQQGVQEKQGKYLTFITSYMQFLQGALPAIQAMPKGTLAQGIARSNAMITASYQWGQQRA